MHIFLIILLIAAVLLFLLIIFGVPVSQRIINLVLLGLAAAVLASQAGFIR